MGIELIKHYDAALVVLSFAIAVLASYVALDLASRVQLAVGKSRFIWQWGGAIAMGTGIWSMHFVGMLACSFPVAVHYNALTTLLSLVYAILASGLALWLLSRPTHTLMLWIGGGLCMGTAIAWMHYTGMAALQMQATLQYDISLVGLSVVIAVSAALAALWLAVRLQELPAKRQRWQKLGSAVVMAIAISGMHYTGMAATHIMTQPSVMVAHATTLNQPWLAGYVAAATLLILSLTLLISLFDQQLAARRAREELLQASEAKFRSLVSDMQVGVLLCDATATLLLSNQSAFELLGLSVEGAKARTFPFNLTFLKEDGSLFPYHQLPIQQAIAQRTAIRDVVMGLDLPSQSDRRWLLVGATPQLSGDGQVERVVCTLSDISDRRQAETAVGKLADLERTTSTVIQHMRQTLDLPTIFNTTCQELQNALRSDRVLIYRFNPDWSGEFTSEAVSEGWIPLLAQTRQDSQLTQNAVDHASCITTKLEATDPLICDTYLNKHAQEIYYQRGAYCCVADVAQAGFDDCYLQLLERIQAKAYIIAPIFCGPTLWGLLAVYQNSAPRRWRETEIQLVVKIANPLGVAVQQAELFAQTQQQAEDLKYAKEVADAANRAKSEFLANMSHELRTPLNAILGFAQLMMGDRALNLAHQQYIEIINQSGEHLLRLINDVLEMSKIEAGRVVLSETEFDLHKLLRKLEAMMQLKASDKGLKLQFVCEADVPQHIKTDENKLRQVLTNLLSNAIKFTEQGTVTLRIRCNSTLPWDDAPPNTYCLVFEVDDTGVGIAADELDDLFKPFSQTRSGRHSQEGTGLGLRISKRFVELMKGELTVKSQPHVGSCFTFFIRIEKAQPIPELSSSTASTHTLEHYKPKQTYRILITEDNSTNRLLLKTLLCRVGAEVREAVNGEEAIAIWQSWQPHLILMDMQMPTLDGYAATRKIREIEQQIHATGHDATTIIALTASAFANQQQESREAGCNDFLSKPFSHQDLLKLLSTYLDIQGQADSIAPIEPELNPFSQDSLSGTLSMMSAEWRDRLYCAAAQGNDVESLSLIAQIPDGYTTLTSTLTQWVHTYQFDRLLIHLQDDSHQPNAVLSVSPST